MGFIERKNILIYKLTCSHPEVVRIWEYGGAAAMPTNGGMDRVVCLLMKNGEIKQFSDGGDGKAEKEAEDFLELLK